jgi:hypothetical protein
MIGLLLWMGGQASINRQEVRHGGDAERVGARSRWCRSQVCCRLWNMQFGPVRGEDHQAAAEIAPIDGAIDEKRLTVERVSRVSDRD